MAKGSTTTIDTIVEKIPYDPHRMPYDDPLVAKWWHQAEQVVLGLVKTIPYTPMTVLIDVIPVFKEYLPIEYNSFGMKLVIWNMIHDGNICMTSDRKLYVPD
jgi:hypothetical protein